MKYTDVYKMIMQKRAARFNSYGNLSREQEEAVGAQLEKQLKLNPKMKQFRPTAAFIKRYKLPKAYYVNLNGD